MHRLSFVNLFVSFRIMATDEDETPRAMIGQFIQRHQSSKSTRIAPGRGLRNRPRSSSLGVDADIVVEVHRVGQRTATKARLSTSEFTPHNTVSIIKAEILLSAA